MKHLFNILSPISELTSCSMFDTSTEIRLFYISWSGEHWTHIELLKEFSLSSSFGSIKRKFEFNPFLSVHIYQCWVFIPHCFGQHFIWSYHSFRAEADHIALVREKNYATRISMEWLHDSSKQLATVLTAVFSSTLHISGILSSWVAIDTPFLK